MTTPMVSVVLPTRNRSAMVGRAVSSVLDQTADDLELIVVDDGSTDDTEAVVGAIDDPRLSYVRLDRHRGAAVARNTGLRRARGQFLAFQDSDDEWLPNKLELQLELLRQHSPEVGAVGGRYAVVDAGSMSAQISAPRLESGRDYEPELLEGPCCITPVWLIKRKLVFELGLFDERMPCLEDWDLMLRLSQRTGMRAVAENVLIKRGDGASLGADVSRRAPAMEELLRRHGRRFLSYPRRHAGFCLELSYLLLATGQPVKAARYAARTLRRRGASGQMLAVFAKACARAVSSGRATWPVPGLAEAESRTRS